MRRVTLSRSWKKDSNHHKSALPLYNKAWIWQCAFVVMMMVLTIVRANGATDLHQMDVVINCPSPVNISCEASTAPGSTGEPSSVTNCATSNDVSYTFDDDVSGLTSCSNTGSIIREWTATDQCGSTNSCVQVITIEDVTSPTIMCPSTMSISCEDDTSPASLGFPVVSDNCALTADINITNSDQTENLTNCNGTGTFTRMWHATDPCGNNAVCTQTIIISDQENPNLICPADMQVSCDGNIDPETTGWATADDNCTPPDDLIINHSDNLLGLTGCQGTGTVVRTWQVNDACGNISNCTQIITVIDESAPSISCPANANISCSDDITPALLGEPTAEDNCGIPIIAHSDDVSLLLGCNNSGIITRVWTATDGCGNENSCQQIINITDHVNPEITCPENANIDCSESLDPTNTGQLEANDNCSFGSDLDVTYVDLPEDLSGCNSTGVIQRTWTATDACGNIASCLQLIIVTDDIAPSIQCPADLVISCDASILPNNTGEATFSDNCSASEEIILDYNDDDSNAIGCNGTGMIARTWSVQDACGNTNACTQAIMIIDDVQPTLTCAPETTISCEESNTPEAIGFSTAEDNCTAVDDIEIGFTDIENFNGCNETGTLLRTWTARDVCGNSISCTQIVHIVDNTAPTTTCPQDVVLSCTDEVGPDFTGYPESTDNCTPSEELEMNYVNDQSGLTDCMMTGTLIRNWTVIDACNNIATCQQSITIQDIESPTIDCPEGIEISCEDDYSVAALGNASAEDNCTPTLLIVISSEDNTDVLPACNATGILVRTFTAEDACGNQSSCTQTIQVVDETAPSLQCPASLTFDCGDDISPDAIGYALATDNCSAEEFILVSHEDNTSGLTGCNGTGNMTRTWKAIDLCGNENTCVQTITIEDQKAPNLVCPENTSVACGSSIDTTITGNILVIDNCTDFSSLSINMEDVEDGLVGCNGSGSVIRTWTVEDLCGNISTCEQQITISDDVPPVIACGDPITIDCGTSQDTSSVRPPEVTDNCSDASAISTLFFDNATGLTGCNGSGTLIRNWIAFDGCGNMSTCDQIIEVEDRKAPVIIVPADKEVNCELADDLGVLGMATAEDDCSPADDVNVYFVDNDNGLTGCNGTGQRVRMWIAADGCGNIDTAYQNIYLIDTLAPLFYCPLDLEVDTDADIFDMDEMGEVEVLVDNCAPLSDVEINYTDDVENLENCDSAPTIKRTWAVSDQCGNVGTCVQRIAISEYSIPLVSFPADMDINCEDDIYDMSITGAPSMSAGVAELLIDTVYYVDMQVADKENDFLQMREWFAYDYCGNVKIDTQYITVFDDRAPQISLQDIALTFTENATYEILLEDILIEGTDNCTPSISYAISPSALTCDDFLNANEQVITVTATDDHGNATIDQIIAAVVVPQIEFVCPANIVVNLGPGECDAVVNYDVSASVPCGDDPTLSQTDMTDLTNGDFFPIGVTPQVFEATDNLGMTETCSFTITVNGFVGQQFLICNDTINVSVNESCISQIAADEILEGDSYGCYDNFVLSSPDPTVQFVDGELNSVLYVGEYIEICVTDTTTGNFCCGIAFIEDKLAPVIECPPNDTINCTMDFSPIALDLFPVPTTSVVTPLPGGDFLATGVDNCNTVTLSFEDEEQINMCEGDYIKIITRLWTAIDQFGNIDTCSHQIYLERGLLEDFTFPQDTTLECGSACLFPDGTPDPNCTGNIEGAFCDQFFVAMEDKRIDGCGNTYSIKRTWTLIDWCDPDVIIDSIQIINIDDTTPPVVSCPDTIQVPLDLNMCTGTVMLTPPPATDACGAEPIEFSLTNGIETYVDVNGVFTIEDLTIGSYTYTWNIKDACGNNTTCSFVVTVVDNVVPVALCDLHTVVAIQNEDDMGVSLSPATVFDDGSFDNCSDVSFRVRRMQSCIDFDWNDPQDLHFPDGVVNGFDNGLTFRETVPFSCCDVNSPEPIMVQLEVTDEAGNVNYCMVEVEVQDKIAPEIICAPDIFISCEYWFDDSNLDDLNNRTFGTVVDGFIFDESDRQPIIINDPGNPNLPQPYNWGFDGFATDNCNLDLTLTVRIFDDCSGETLPGNAPTGAIRLIERRFTATDPNGKVTTCVQRIWVINYDPFFINASNPFDPTDDVIWPADIEVDHCGIPDTIYPTILNDQCGTIGVNLKETKLQFDEGSCMKILREWSVIDWCQYNSTTGEGLWKYTQVVKISDNAAAVFTDCPDDMITICSADDNVTDVPATIDEMNPCAAHVVLDHVIEDVCSEQITYDVKLYPFNTGAPILVVGPTQVNMEGGIATISFDSKNSSVQSIRLNGIPYNSVADQNDAHRILFTVVDACGNLSTCEYLFRLVDCKQPTPVCINGLSSVVMPSNGEVTIWASEFDASSTDNCTENLLFSFSGDVYEPSHIYTCANIPGVGVQIPVEIWVWDASGNRDFCTTNIVITDNDDVCGFGQSGIVGDVSTNGNDMIENATVTITNPNSFFSSVTTIEDGQYHFSNIPAGTNYDVRVERNDDHKNGLSSLDIVRIQKHLLGVQPFDNPYDFIAADVNNNQSVSALDIIELRKLVLGVYLEFPNNTSWRFVPKNYEFSDPFNPWPFDEFITMDVDTGMIVQEDFTGIKVGDLNNTVAANATQIITRNAEENKTLYWEIADAKNGSSQTINIYSKESFDLNGMQFTLAAEHLNLIEINSEVLDITSNNYAKIKDKLTFSWSSADAYFTDEENPIFSIKVSVKNGGKIKTSDIEELTMTSDITQAELYDADENIFGLILEAKNGERPNITLDTELALHQNIPNPFDSETMITFDLANETNVKLSIFTANGQLILTRENDFLKGQHQWSVKAAELAGAGLYYYTIQTAEGQMMTKKMILSQ